ncbi:hypothetical protein IJS64_00110 [bacterium]|nr:hypothetical protein [bacterium]
MCPVQVPLRELISTIADTPSFSTLYTPISNEGASLSLENDSLLSTGYALAT